VAQIPSQGAIMRRTSWLVAISATAFALVLPNVSHADGIISALSVSPDTVRDGAPSVGTVLLAFPDPAPTTALLFSSDSTVASVPPTVVIPAGAMSANFAITTNAAAPPTIVQLTAAVDNVPRTANLSVNPARPPGPSLSAVSVVPSTLAGGSAATGTVTFTGTTDAFTVRLASSNTALVTVPAETVV